MTRAEAWLTGIGALAALLPALIVKFAIADGDGSGRRVIAAGALLGAPGALAVLALAVPDRRGFRVVLLASATFIALPMAFATSLGALPALLTLGAAASVTVRRADDESVASLWPQVLLVPTIGAAWVVAGLIFIRANEISCDPFGGPNGTVCSVHMSTGEFFSVIALLVMPVILIAHFWRSPQHPAQL